MVIRRAKPGDIPALMALASESATAAHWTEQQYRSAFESHKPERLILLAEDESAAGFAVASGVGEEWELENIVVEPARQGQGIGRGLLGSLVSELKNTGANRLFLEVRQSNTAARRLYERCGFLESGRRRGYYHNPVEDAILYEKNLGFSAPEIG